MTDLTDAIIIGYDHHQPLVNNFGAYYEVWATSGKSYKVNQTNKKATAIIDNAKKGEALILVKKTFTKQDNGKDVEITYIEEVRRIADELNRKAIEKLLITVLSQQDACRYRSQAIAYAKDLKCAYSETDLYGMATGIYKFIIGEYDAEIKTQDAQADGESTTLP